MSKALTLLMCLFGLTCSTGLAQDPEDELAGDRPDFTENALTIPRGRFQLEMGTTLEKPPGAKHSWDGPEALLRLGLGKTTEFRLGLPSTETVETGLKQSLVKDAGGLALTVLGSVSFPDLESVEPRAALLWEKGISEAYSLAGQVAVVGTRDNGNWTTGSQLTLTLGGDLTRRIGTFVEYVLEAGEQSAPVHLIHHGYTWLTLSRLQFDVHAGVGLSPAAPDYFVGLGMIARLNRRSREGGAVPRRSPARRVIYD